MMYACVVIQENDETDYILALALQRRQREIEEDMRREEMEYNNQLERLRQSVRHASLNEVHLHLECMIFVSFNMDGNDC